MWGGGGWERVGASVGPGPGRSENNRPPPIRIGDDMDKIKPLFTATATAVGGRNGHSEASDGSVKADLSVPKAMGGPRKPGTTTPEHLFATRYPAGFASDLD